MDFVGDYTSKKKLAEALRKRQEAMSGMVGSIDTQPVYTQANQSFPGQTDVNWGAPIANIGLALLGRRAEGKATAAEEEAQAARLEALKSAMGAVSGGGQLTPEQIIQFGELGVDSDVLKMIQPDKSKSGAVYQAADTPAGVKLLVMKGELSPEEGEQMIAQLNADAAAKTQAEKDLIEWEQSKKRFAPDSGASMTEHDRKLALYNEDPEKYAAIYGLKNEGSGSGSGGGFSGKRYDPKREADTLLNAAETIEKMIIEDKDNTMFSLGQKAAVAGTELGTELPGSVLGKIAKVAGGHFTDPRVAEMQRQAVLVTLESVAKMAPASDTDVRIIMQTAPNVFQNQESALAFTAAMRRTVAKFGDGKWANENPDIVNQQVQEYLGGMGGMATGDEELDAEIAEIMGL